MGLVQGHREKVTWAMSSPVRGSKPPVGLALILGSVFACAAILVSVTWYRGVMQESDLGPWEGYYFTTEQAEENQSRLETALLSAYLHKVLGEPFSEDLKVADDWSDNLTSRWNVLNSTTGLMSALTRDEDVAKSVALVDGFIPRLDQGHELIAANDKDGFKRWMVDFEAVRRSLRVITLKARDLEIEQRSKYRESVETSKLRLQASAWLFACALAGLFGAGWFWWTWKTRQLQAEASSIEIAKQAVDAKIDAVAASAVSERARFSFISAVAHELRTPMQSLMSAANLLAIIQRNRKSEADEELRVIADRIEVAVDQMRIQLKDLTDFAKSPGKTQGDLSAELFSLKEWFDAMVLSVQALGDRSPAHLAFDFHGDEDVTVVGDPGRLLQIANNLIGNALKYTPKGKVHVTVSSVDRGNEAASPQAMVTLVVADTGVGISEADLPHVTQPFYRGVNAKSGQNTGLGLAIVANLVERMHGRLDIQSTLGNGTTVRVTVPMSIDKKRERPVVMVADDDVADDIAKVMTELGCEAHVARSPGECVHLADDYRFDLILMGMHLGGADCRSIAANLSVKAVANRVPLKIVALTSIQDEAPNADGLFYRVLEKPVNVKQLEALLQ